MRRTRARALVIATVAVLAVALGACGDDDSDDTADVPGAPTTTAGPEPTEAPTAPPDGAVTVATATTDLGTVLVDGEGFTLYIFTQDGPNESTCGPGCIELWPAAAVDGDISVGDGLDAGQFGSIERDDGTTQLTVGEQPLYRYTPDGAPGDTTGHGVGGVWFAVDATGEPLD